MKKKTIISTLVTVSMVMTLFTGTVFANPGNGNGNNNGKEKEFKDMKGHWGTESVTKIQSYGLINGYSDGTFQPDNAITQAELAVIIDRLVQLKQNLADDEATIDEYATVKDVPNWAKKSVLKGVEKKYLNLKRFHSQAQCDRLTASVALAKALELKPVTNFTFNPFADRGLMSDEDDYGYILALYKAGLIKGYPNGNFNPNALISRAQMASIIDKLLDDDDVVVSDDKEEPTWPASSAITASSITVNSAVLNWSAAADNVKVVGYKVSYIVNGTEKVKYVSSARTTNITGLVPDKEYTFTVEAKDTVGNWSNNGPSVVITTLESTPDTTSPTWASGAALTVSPSSATMVTLIWPDAEDNVAVKGYKVYQDGVLIKTLEADANDLIVPGLKEKTGYTFKVRAYDEAGNLSSVLSKIFLTD